jgi:hypothetical protein
MVVNAFMAPPIQSFRAFFGMNANNPFVEVKTKINLILIVNDKQSQSIQ